MADFVDIPSGRLQFAKKEQEVCAVFCKVFCSAFYSLSVFFSLLQSSRETLYHRDISV